MSNTGFTVETNDFSTQNTPEIPFFKTERGFNINVPAIARAAQNNILSVERIAVPSRVRRQRRRTDASDTPSLSEIGGGEECEYCQVIAGADARPVNIDNVLFVNTDPEQMGINHGTAAVARDSIFSLGWKRNGDRVILIYKIVDTAEYAVHKPGGQNAEGEARREQPIAKLTCDLLGHSLESWRGKHSSLLPSTLEALYGTTVQRLTTDWHAPLYMDVFRMKTVTDTSKKVASEMRNGLFGPVQECQPNEFISNVMSEIFDIRAGQYAKLAQGADRRVEHLHAVETIDYNPADGSITVELVIPRTDDAMAVHFRVNLTPENYIDNEGRQVLERGLVLRMPTFERLKAELDRHPNNSIDVNLTSLR